jgi:Ni,Fe-hydrogenase I small subunit
MKIHTGLCILARRASVPALLLNIPTGLERISFRSGSTTHGRGGAVWNRAVVNVPGCPPIAEVMTGVLTYILTFNALPELDRMGRPKMFCGQGSSRRASERGRSYRT